LRLAKGKFEWNGVTQKANSVRTGKQAEPKLKTFPRDRRPNT